LFRAKNIVSGPELVRSFLDAYLSSQEEGIFGTFLEGLARFICERVYRGHKSSAEGIDLEFTKKGVTYIVSIKSGPNWGNASQIRRMIDNFRKAKRILGTNVGRQNVVAVNGCCYGKRVSLIKATTSSYVAKNFGNSFLEMPISISTSSSRSVIKRRNATKHFKLNTPK
jgi:anthranilate/para-aminobenzoate synthase component II